MRGQLPGGTTKGVAAGVGTAEMKNDGRSTEVNFNGERVWRVGGYKVTHCQGELTIGLMMDVAPLTADGCLLVYRGRNKPSLLYCKHRLLPNNVVSSMHYAQSACHLATHRM